MLRRLIGFCLGLALLSGCGGESPGEITGVPGDSSSGAITQADAKAAFAQLGGLGDAWKRKDCASIASLTTWAEHTLGERLCEAARNDRPAPGFTAYDDPQFLLPDADADSDDDPWFAVLAPRPKPAYFVFVRSLGRWRLGAGPIPVLGDAPETGDDVAAPTGGAGLRARLVPTRHVAFLTDPANVGGVKFAGGDPMRDLLSELVRAPLKARPDRLSTDVRLEGPARALALPDGSALVFHALRVVFTQKPASGRSTLAHFRYGATDLRAFTGESKPGAVTSSELVLLATKVAKDNVMTTVALRRSLADMAPGDDSE